MLDAYKDGQPFVYDMMVRMLKNNKISHAYLIETNNGNQSFDMVFSFAKSIICPNHYTNSFLCKDCNICKRIDENNYTEIKIIEPDGTWIKKEQLMDLQENFNMIGLESQRRVYIIKECDKMNKQTANSILKFLEEPVPNVIAILVTDNINKLLDTIISRCQYIKLEKSETDKNNTTYDNVVNLLCKTKEEKEKFISDDENKKLLDDIVNFVLDYEESKLNIIINIKNKWHNKFNNRESVDIAFNLLINFYYDVLKYKNGKENLFFVDRQKDIIKVSELNEDNDIIRKIEILIENREYLKYNLNLNLLINKILIDFGGGINGNSNY